MGLLQSLLKLSRLKTMVATSRASMVDQVATISLQGATVIQEEALHPSILQIAKDLLLGQIIML